MAEMNPILEIVAHTGLKVESADVWKDIPYVWANALYGGFKQPFAKYIFTYTDAKQWSQWDQWGDSFVTEVIEPVYFQLANDISWNLYWISVLEDAEMREVDIQQRIAFSSNTEYTRNLMVPAERLSEFIPVGRIQMEVSKEEILLPSECWLEQLDKNDLCFCLYEFSKNALESYVEDKNMEGTGKVSNAPTEVSTGDHSLTMLHSVEIPKDFRAHYYPKDWTIPFQGVNLLYGVNGAGKTSVLSAIELAITGEIRNIAMAEDASTKSEVVLTAEIDGCNAKLHPPRKPAEKKRLERHLYKSRNTNRTAPQIQNLFHQFNYLSVEETFLFAREQPDLSDAFSKILYGPETSDMWKHLGRYKDECKALMARYDQDLTRFANQIESLSKVSPVDKSALQAYFAASGLRFNSDESPEAILEKAQTILAEYDKVKVLSPILPQAQLEKVQSEQSKQIAGLKEDVRALSENLKQANALATTLINEHTELQNQQKKIGQALESFQALTPLMGQLQFRIHYRAMLANYQEWLEKKLNCEDKEKKLQQLIKDYAETLEALPSKSMQELRKEARELQENRTDLNIQRNALQSQIDHEEITREKRTKLFSVLGTTGLELYQVDEGRHSCPLCGTEGITEEILRAHLEEEAAQGDQQLQTLYQALNNIEENIQNNTSALKRLDQQMIIAQEYVRVLNTVQRAFPNIQIITDLRNEYNKIQEQSTASKEKAEQIKEVLQAELKKACLPCTIEDILDSQRNLLTQAPTEYISLPSDASGQNLLDNISVAKSNWESLKKKYDLQFSQNQETLKKQLDTVNGYNQDIRGKQQMLKQMEAESTRLEQIAAFWEAIKPMVEADSLSGEAVQNLCQKIYTMARDIIKSKEIEATRRQLRERIDVAEKKKNQCRILQTELDRLQPPEAYAEKFISQNIEQISRIFLAIHSPQEFSGLGMTADHKLTALRNNEEVPISHMSTGQRTALVISVFFQMNLATASVPNFLLLDEPVANIDDLNMLALMDFLREMAITCKKQIFFTTANRNVAKLFRRKFSFLQDEFLELRFAREKENCLRIAKRSYNQSSLVESSNL